MSIVVLSGDEMGFAPVICEGMMIVLIALEPVRHPYLKRFVQRLLAAFILEGLLLIAQVFTIYMNILTESTAILWRTYEIIRIFINLSLCYPTYLFIGEKGHKLQRLSVVVCCLVIQGRISDYLHYDVHSGINLIAFMLIFLFTFYQYIQLRHQIDEEIPRLKSLMALEFALIVLDGILIVFFFTSGYEENLLLTVKITMSILQYQKFYMIISVMTYFD